MIPLIYVLHIGFFAIFLLRLADRRKAGGATPATPAPQTGSPQTGAPSAPHAVGLIVLHAAAFSVFYFGLGQALFARRGARLLLAAHPVIGGATVVAGAGVLAWSLIVFRSWRLLARIEPGHQLCTAGPFRIVRHPIYLSLDLLALGTFLWVPNPVVLVGAILIVVAGDLRARSEERLLCAVFGDEYRDFQRRVPRTIPGLY